MNVNDISNLITTVGFPIAMCVMMYYTNTKTIKELTKSLNDNTIVLQKILHWIDKKDE